MVLEKYKVPLLDLFVPSSPEHPVSFGPGMFADRLSPFLRAGHTRYGKYVYSGDEMEDDCLVHSFDGPMGRFSLRLSIGNAPPEATFSTRHLYGEVIEDDRSADERSKVPIEDYLGFLFCLADSPSDRFKMPSRSRSVVADSTQEWGADLDIQFFLEEPGHDFLGIFNAVFGLRWPVAALFHSERECGNMGVYNSIPLLGMSPSRMETRPGSRLAEHLYFTDITDAETVMGGEDRLRDRLEEVMKNDDSILLMVGETCLPRVVGDDVESCVDDTRRSFGENIVYMDVSRMDHEAPFHSIQRTWSEVLSAVAETEPEKDTRSINLIGYGASTMRDVLELHRLLEGVGVRVNADLFPCLTLDDARGFNRAAVNVVNRWYYIERSFAAVESWSGLPNIRPGSPYGPDGTGDWLAEIASSVLHRDIAEIEVPDMSCGEKEQFERLHERAAGCGVAFVVPSTQTHSLVDETRSHGVPFPSFLSQMGFGITVIYFDPPEARNERARVPPGDFDTLLRDRYGQGAHLHVFEDRNALSGMLDDQGFDIVYSEFREDPRVRASGKVQVMVTDFEMGYKGCLRTMSRLVRRAGNPFRAIYSRFHSRES